MAKVSFGAAREAAEKSGALSTGDRFKLTEGNNRVRLLSEFLPHTSYFTPKATPGNPSPPSSRRFQWLGYVLDRKDSQVKTFFMPHTIHKFIEDLQSNEDWAFDEVPMPYDITIVATGAGTKDVKYSVTPSPKRTKLTPEEMLAFAEKKPIAEVQQAIYDKQNENPPETTRPYEPDEMPA